LSEDEAFYRSLDQELERARASGTPVSLAVSNLPKKLATEWGRERYLSYLGKIELVLHSLSRQADRIWLRAESGEIAVLLYDMAEGREEFLDRFKASLKETMPEYDSVVQCDVVVSPKDGNTARELHRSVTGRRKSRPSADSPLLSRTSSISGGKQ
jgi:hypothetical protein